MDIAGTKKKIQRLSKVAEESYKKMNELIERMQALQADVEETSAQVDEMEYSLAEQRAILEALAAEQGLDVEALLEEADLPPEPTADSTEETSPETVASSRPTPNESE